MEKQAPAIFSRCLIYLLVCVLTVSSVAPDSPIYISLTTGEDSLLCGPPTIPCKTLEYSLYKVTDGGSLFLDGTDSRDNPYKCGPGTRTIIGKNLRISSWFARAHISCEIWFILNPPGRTGMRSTTSSGLCPSPSTSDGLDRESGFMVSIGNLTFVQSGVTCIGRSCYVEVENSSFEQGGLTCNGLCSLNVVNSTFANPTMASVQYGVTCSGTSCYVEVENSSFEQSGLTCNGLRCSLNVVNSTFANPIIAHIQPRVACYGAIISRLEVANTLFVQANLVCSRSCFVKVSTSNFNSSAIIVSTRTGKKCYVEVENSSFEQGGLTCNGSICSLNVVNSTFANPTMASVQYGVTCSGTSCYVEVENSSFEQSGLTCNGLRCSLNVVNSTFANPIIAHIQPGVACYGAIISRLEVANTLFVQANLVCSRSCFVKVSTSNFNSSAIIVSTRTGKKCYVEVENSSFEQGGLTCNGSICSLNVVNSTFANPTMARVQSGVTCSGTSCYVEVENSSFEQSGLTCNGLRCSLNVVNSTFANPIIAHIQPGVACYGAIISRLEVANTLFVQANLVCSRSCFVKVSTSNFNNSAIIVSTRTGKKCYVEVENSSFEQGGLTCNGSICSLNVVNSTFANPTMARVQSGVTCSGTSCYVEVENSTFEQSGLTCNGLRCSLNVVNSTFANPIIAHIQPGVACYGAIISRLEVANTLFVQANLVCSRSCFVKVSPSNFNNSAIIVSTRTGKKCYVEVENSSFEQGGLTCNGSICSLNVVNSTFANPTMARVQSGVTCSGTSCYVEVENSTFEQSGLTCNGLRCSLNVVNSTFANPIIAHIQPGVACYGAIISRLEVANTLFVQANLVCSRSCFVKVSTSNFNNSAIIVSTRTGKKCYVEVENSSFEQGGLTCNGSICSLNVVNSTFANPTMARVQSGVTCSGTSCYVEVENSSFEQGGLTCYGLRCSLNVVNSTFANPTMARVQSGVTCSETSCYVEVKNSSFEQGGLTCNGLRCSLNVVNSTFANPSIAHIQPGVACYGAIISRLEVANTLFVQANLVCNRSCFVNVWNSNFNNSAIIVSTGTGKKCYVEVENSSFEQGGLTCNGLICSLNVVNSIFANPTIAHIQSSVACYGAIICRLEVANTLFVQASLICNRSCFVNVWNSNFSNSAAIIVSTDTGTGTETKCYVEVKNSSFEQGGLTCNGLRCSLNVVNSIFANPTIAHIQSGVACYGAIICRLEVVNTLFVQASLICGRSCFVNVSSSNFDNSAITVSTDVNAGENANMTSVAIAHSNFIRNRPQSLIKFNCQLGFELKIYHCNFRDDYRNPFPDSLIDLHSSPPSVGRVRVAFNRNNFTAIAGPGFNLRGCFDSISFEDLSMIDMKSFVLRVNEKHQNCQPRSVTVQMNNCLFSGTLGLANSLAAAIYIEAREITILMNYMQFHSNNCSFIFFHSKKGSLTISNSDFAYNTVGDDNVHLLLISEKYPSGELSNSPKIAEKQEQDGVAGSTVLNIQSTKFSFNKALRSIITLSHTLATLSNVTFINNTEGFGGDIHIKDQSSVSLNSCRFEHSSRNNFASAFVYSEVSSNSTVNIINCRFKSHVEFDASLVFFLRSGIRLYADKQSYITCPLGYFLELNTPNVSLSGSLINDTYQPTCKKCSVGLYNLQQVYAIPDSSANEQCIPCPYGGNCTHGIEAKPNFWGYLEPEDHRPTVKFEICPLGYCEPSPGSFNSCHGYRNGFLCGQCIEGYTEAMFSSECYEEENCHNNWFWFFSFLYIACLSFLLITRPCIFQMLWRNAVWFRPKSRERKPSQSLHSSDGQRCSGEHFDHALVKTIFYFYQTVELLLISTSPEDLMNTVTFVRPFISLFNFETLNEKFGCPFPGLTAVTKRLFSSLTVFGTIACISMICISHKAMSYIGCFDNSGVNLYLVATVETLLLGYEKLSEVSLNLMNCIQAKSEWRLFQDGNILCWQWWQYVLLSFIMVFVVPFIFVLFWGSKKLNERIVSTKELTAACFLPLPFLCYWAIRFCIKKEPSHEHFEEAEEIKEVLHEPFRPPSGDDEGALYWESVLIARRLVLLCLHSFIADPMLRLLCLTFACMAILLHHLYKRPFRDPMANACETFSLIALVIISTSSLAEATLVSSGTEIGGPIKSVFEVLQWIELALLGVVPACLFLLLSLIVLSQFFRLFFHIIMWVKRQPQKLRRHWRFPVDVQRPLLYPSPSM